MSVVEIAVPAAVAIAAAGAYMRWGVRPVVIAYHVGRQAERLIANPARYSKVFRLGLRIGHRDRVSGR